MRADRDDGGIYRGVTGHRQVIGCTYQRYVLEVGKIRQFVQHGEELLLRRTQAQIANVHALIDRPPQAGSENGTLTRKRGTQNTDAVEFALGRQCADDSSAGRAMAEEIAMRLGVV